MGRYRTNRLQIVLLPDGKFLLHGHLFGQQIRRRHKDVAVLESLKRHLEAPAIAQEMARQAEAGTRVAELTKSEEATAKAIFSLLGGLDPMEVVRAGLQVVRTQQRQFPANRALVLWKRKLLRHHRRPRTLEKNLQAVRRFLRSLPACRSLTDITPKSLESYILRPGVSVGTQITEGATIRAWLNFCEAEKLIARSPFSLDLNDLKQANPDRERPRILTPEQAHKLLACARKLYGGKFAPYVVLACWCFMRHAEVVSTQPEDILADKIRVNPKKFGTVSYRNVTIPANVREILRANRQVFWSKEKWDSLREMAGLLKRAKPDKRGGNRKHLRSIWQSNILRHTGISYLFQQTGDIKEVCRQAGNSSDVSFRHYLDLPADGASAKFYRPISAS